MMKPTLQHALPGTLGAGQLANTHLTRYDTDLHDETGQDTLDPFAGEAAVKTQPTIRPIVSDLEMLVPATASLYSPASDSIGDIVGRAAAPYFDAIQGSVRKLLHRDPPKIYTTLPTAQELKDYTVTAPPRPLTWQHYAAAGLATTALATGCTTGSDLADTITKAVTLNLAGGLAIFLYGMKQMSDGVKASSGDTLKKVIGRLAGNRISSMLVGTGVTSVIQSSSVTSVLTLGLVHAGVMNLTQALGVIAGANVGTTMTAWLMSTGFSKYGLALVGGAGLTYLFSKKSRTREISKGIMGLGMVFHGLKVMSAGFKNPEITSRLTSLFSSLNDPSVGGLATCMLVGAGVTAAIQSSSATLGICIALAAKGIIPFEAAVGISLGANIGTTITAWLAAPGATVEAKRVAVAHTAFNIGGALLILPICPQFAAYSKDLALTLGITSPAKQVAFVHTLFNVGAMALFLPFLGQIKNGIVRLVPDKKPGEEIDEWSLKIVKGAGAGPALLQSQQVIDKAGDRVRVELSEMQAFLSGNRDAFDVDAIVRSVESDLDRAQASTTAHFNRVERLKLGKKHSYRLDIQRTVIDELESMSDHLMNLMLVYSRGIPEALPAHDRELLEQVHGKTVQLFVEASAGARKGRRDIFEEIKPEYGQLKELLRSRYVVNPGPNVSAPQAARAQIFFGSVLQLYSRTLSHVRNIAEAPSETPNSDA